MSRSLIIGVASAALLCGAASAGDMSGVIGNTIECHYTDGKVTKVWVEAGGHYSIQRPDGSTAKGTWADDGTNVCYTDTDPAPPPTMKPVCSSSQLRKIGETWDVTDPMGGHCTASVTAGHH